MGSLPVEDQTQTQPCTPFGLQPSILTAKCHPLVEQVTEEVDAYFSEHWPFKDEKTRKKFLSQGIPRVTCLYCANALDDRIAFACKLITITFLTDDVLDHMSLDDGVMYNEKLMRLARGDEQPDRSVPVEYLMYDIWESMRAHDKDLADEVLEPAFVFMRAQVDKQRLKPMDLHTYFDYREQDVGKAFLSAIMRFSMGLHMTSAELDLARPVEENCSKSISVVNDICSYEKEVRIAARGHEGGVLCSSVPIMQQIANVDVPGAKRILWQMCREWEVRHRQLVDEVTMKNQSPALAAYLEGLEYQMAGNEVWSLITPRYNDVTVG